MWPHTVGTSPQTPRATVDCDLPTEKYALESAHALHVRLGHCGSVAHVHTAGCRSSVAAIAAPSLSHSESHIPWSPLRPRASPLPPDTLAWQVGGGSHVICPPPSRPGGEDLASSGPSRRITSACGTASSRAQSMASRENDTDCMRHGGMHWSHAYDSYAAPPCLETSMPAASISADTRSKPVTLRR